MNPRLPLAVLAALLAAPVLAQEAGAPVPDNRRIVTCREGASLSSCADVVRRQGGTVVRELPFIHGLSVDWADARSVVDGPVAASGRAVEAVVDDPEIDWLQGAGAPARGLEVNELQFGDWFRWPRPRPVPTEDPEYLDWGVQRVRAHGAWGRTDGAGVKVAVIDTGVDRDHPDLVGAIAGGYNAVDPAAPQAWDDDQGHGTHVAGTIAAQSNEVGGVGVAPGARIYAVKVLDRRGRGRISTVIAGIAWAAENGMQVANLSLGAPRGEPPLHAAIRAAVNAGVVVVAAAGNSGGAVGFPGGYPEAICVAASDRHDRVASFSSRGPEVDLIAPGVDIRSARKDGGWRNLSGTSMATPHVAGLAALAIANGVPPAGVRQTLVGAASPLRGLNASLQGAGMVDAARMLGCSPMPRGQYSCR